MHATAMSTLQLPKCVFRKFIVMQYQTRKHSGGMLTDRAVTRPSSEPVSMKLIVVRQTPVKTLLSLAVGN